jgi:hypothetical protein
MADTVIRLALKLKVSGPSGHETLETLGTATIGTQAGVEHVCNPDGVADLMKQLGNSGTDQPFEALLHITIVNDVPIETKIMIVHRPH